MNTEIYLINSKKFTPITNGVNTELLDDNSFYLHVVECAKRKEAVDYIESYLPKNNILEYILKPEDHIRFEIFNEISYGEVAYFSASKVDHISYIGVIRYDKRVFIIKNKSLNIINQLQESFMKIGDLNPTKIEPKYLIYMLFVEVITNLSKKIFIFREKIEDTARELNKTMSFEPEDFLRSKSAFSDFGRVAEKLFFTLYFPPVRTIFDHESAYRKYFEELIKSVEILKSSISQAEGRLDGLHEHYLLLLQERSNKRINFLTIIQSIFAPLTLLVGIYGMNFSNMPELNFKYGYFILLAVMLLIASIFMRYFYKKGWFK